MGVKDTDPLTQLSLPPGFRFYPTDEELLVQYLCKRVAGHQLPLQIIGEIDLYKYDPWILPSKAIFGEKEWYFFSPRDRKYPNGSRPNRVAGSGYWKATGTDKVITTEGRKVGVKKALVFYVGKALKGAKTNWIMHEYCLLDSSSKHGSSKLDDWVLCRIYKKNSPGGQKPILFSSSVSTSSKEQSTSSSPSSHLEDVLDCLPEIDERLLHLPRVNSIKQLNLNNLGSGNFDWANLAGLNSVPELCYNQPQNLGGYSSGNRNDIYTPGLTYQGVGRMGNSVGEEVQSGARKQQANNTDMFMQNSTNCVVTQGGNQVDPYGSRYMNQPGFRFGFRQ